MIIKPLLVIFSAREIKDFYDATSKLKVDKLWIKNYSQLIAYPLARNEFLKEKYKDYTHFVILADDLIVTPEDLNILTEECDNYDVISGWCNLWRHGPYSHLSNLSYELPPDPPAGGTTESYNFFPIDYVLWLRDWPTTIMRIKHQGTALTFLKREVLEDIELKTDLGCCPDAMLSLSLAKIQIPQYVDLRVRMLHLKDSANPVNNVGKLPAEIVYEPT